MKIYTSYFANLENLEANNIYPVAICNKVPAFFKGPNLESVAPSSGILYEFKDSEKTQADVDRYTQRYINEVLCVYRFHPEYLTNLLEFFSQQEGDKDIALLCYERPEDFCHRHILADWLNERLAGRYTIEEFPIYPEPKKKPQKRTQQKKEQPVIKSNELF